MKIVSSKQVCLLYNPKIKSILVNMKKSTSNELYYFIKYEENKYCSNNTEKKQNKFYYLMFLHDGLDKISDTLLINSSPCLHTHCCSFLGYTCSLVHTCSQPLFKSEINQYYIICFIYMLRLKHNK